MSLCDQQEVMSRYDIAMSKTKTMLHEEETMSESDMTIQRRYVMTRINIAISQKETMLYCDEQQKMS